MKRGRRKLKKAMTKRKLVKFLQTEGSGRMSLKRAPRVPPPCLCSRQSHLDSSSECGHTHPGCTLLRTKKPPGPPRYARKSQGAG